MQVFKIKMLLLHINLPLSCNVRWIIHLQITFSWISKMRSFVSEASDILRNHFHEYHRYYYPA